MAPWYVLIEETTGGGERQRWDLSHRRPFASREEALADALALTRDYQPEHPKSPRRREVYRAGEDVWTVWVQGAMRDFHFRVSVVRREGG